VRLLQDGITRDMDDYRIDTRLPAPRGIVVIGANTGGPQALARIIPELPRDLDSTIIICQHMRRGFTRVLAEHLGHLSSLPIHELSDGEALRPSRVLIAPVEHRLSFVQSGDGEDLLVLAEPLPPSTMSESGPVDAAMISAAKLFGRHATGVLLTGLGTDGLEGMRAIHSAGGATIAQDEPSCVVHDMCAAAVDAGVVHELLPLWRIADRVTELAKGEADAIAA